MSAAWTVVVLVGARRRWRSSRSARCCWAAGRSRRGSAALVALLAPALLAALVAINTFGDGRSLTIDARVLGVGAAAIAIWRRAPVLLVIVLAAGTTGARPGPRRLIASGAMTRYRDLGLTVGQLPPGPLNAITDVDGVAVGVTTLIEGDGPLRVGVGPIRTGVTVIVPHDGIGAEPVFAGCHRLNGNGELTGLEWVRESGQLTTPIAITNTHSVGVVRDALVAAEMRGRSDPTAYWSLPVVGETYDGALNDINGMHVRPEHLFAALDGCLDRSRCPRAASAAAPA